MSSALQAKAGDIYQACRSLAKNGESTDIFETAEEAARAYDETALKKDNERAALNLSSEYDYVGQHVKDELYTLTGEDGISVIGVQAGVPSAVRLRLKFFSACCHYLEISLDKASSLPKMDTGLGTCDAYCIIYVGDYRFRTRIGMYIAQIRLSLFLNLPFVLIMADAVVVGCTSSILRAWCALKSIECTLMLCFQFATPLIRLSARPFALPSR